MKSSKSSLFLMEMIIAILFFSLASAVCIQLFVKAHLLGKTTTEENKALLMCQNFSEIYLGVLPEQFTETPEELKEYFLFLLAEDSAFAGITDYTAEYMDVFSTETEFALSLFYSEDWHPVSPDKYSYQIIFSFDGYDTENNVYNASTYAYRVNPAAVSAGSKYDEIYHLNVCKHIPERMP